MPYLAWQPASAIADQATIASKLRQMRNHLQQGMTMRVHPNFKALESQKPTLPSGLDRQLTLPSAAAPETLTVWRKSLLFNCRGFTVFDSKGNLVFRVDNYAKSGNKGEIVLMDAAGNSLLTIRRKKLSIGEHWQIYDGEETANPRFSVRKHVNFLQSKTLAHMTTCAAPPMVCGGGMGWYSVEGSYGQRCCAIYDHRRRAVAEIQRKEAIGGVAFGLDVFRLVLQPGIDAAVSMAVVIVLEEMFGSKGLFIRV